MKLVYAETPATMGQDHSVDDSFLPEGVTHIISEYDPAQPITSEKNQKFVADIKDADIIINSYVDFQEELLDAMDHCKVISFQSTGYNAANLEYAAKKGVAVVSIRDYCTQETAENAIASMMCLQRNTINYNRAIQEDKVWDYSLFPGMKRVEGQTMAIIGFGRIGQHVGRIAGKGLGMKVIAYDPFLPPEIAKEQGVELHFVNTAKPGFGTEYLRELTGGTGYDDVICFAPVRPVVEQADAILGFDGCLNFFAGPTDSNFKAEFNFYNVHYLYTHVVGTSGGNTSDMKEAIEMMTSGRLNPATMLTHIGGLNAVVDTTLNLPNIKGGKKLIYTQIELPLTAIADFEKLGESDPLFAKLAEITARHNGLWSPEAEKYLLQAKA